MSAPIRAVVLAGGSSRRMGTDKALIAIDGHTCLERICNAAQRAGLSVTVLGRKPPIAWHDDAISFRDDDYPGAGPLGGVLTAFADNRDPVLILPCDAPDLDSSTILWLLAAWRDARCDCVVAADGGQANPLFAIYSGACFPLLDAAFAGGERSLARCLSALGAVIVDLPDPQRIADIDTPADLARRLALCV